MKAGPNSNFQAEDCQSNNGWQAQADTHYWYCTGNILLFMHNLGSKILGQLIQVIMHWYFHFSLHMLCENDTPPQKQIFQICWQGWLLFIGLYKEQLQLRTRYTFINFRAIWKECDPMKWQFSVTVVAVTSSAKSCPLTFLGSIGEGNDELLSWHQEKSWQQMRNKSRRDREANVWKVRA